MVHGFIFQKTSFLGMDFDIVICGFEEKNILRRDNFDLAPSLYDNALALRR